MQDSLQYTLGQMGQIPDSDWETFRSILIENRLDKNEFILTEGKVCQGIHFVVRGSVRTYRLLDGREVNTAFHFENDFVCELESLSGGTPSRKFIQTLEASDTIFIPKSRMTGLYRDSPAFQELGRKILEQVVISEQRYASLFTHYSPQDRYAHILQNYPHLVQRIPLQYLASYLGIARETLSRIRKRST